SVLYKLQISAKGNWISYGKHYDYLPDTLIIQSLNNNENRFIYPLAGNLRFNAEENRALIQSDSNLIIQNLVTGKLEKISSVKRNKFTHDDKFLLIEKHDKLIGSDELLIRSLETKKYHSFSGIDRYELNPIENTLLYSLNKKGVYRLYLLDLTKN